MEQLADNLWVIPQRFKYYGLSVGIRMTIIRLSNNELLMISPIKLTEEITAKVDRLGKVKHLVLPNLFHYLFVHQWQEKYPESITYGVSGLKKKRPELTIDKFIDNEQNQSFWTNELDYSPFTGMNTLIPSGISPLGEYVFYHHSTRTLVLTDTAFYFDETFSQTTQIIARLIGSYKKLQPSIIEKLVSYKNKQQINDALQKILTWDFDRVIIAHGNIVETNAKEQFIKGYREFLKN